MDPEHDQNQVELEENEEVDEQEEDEDDEDNQHNTPLIPDGNSRFRRSKLRITTEALKHQPGKGKHSNPVDSTVLSRSNESNAAREGGKPARTSSKQSLNTPPPITIGKIKIFNPRRTPCSGRHRLLRVRRLLKRCFTIIFSLLFLGLLLYNLNRIPEFIRSVLGRDQTLSSSLLGGSSGTNQRKEQGSQCNQVVSSPIWRQNFPMLVVESALRPLFVNNDTVMDIVVPFGTGIDATYYDPVLCQIYFNQSEQQSKTIGCGGGVMAIDGSSGQPIWAQYATHRLKSANCNADLNNDGHSDCVLAGSMASLMAVDGQTGALLWSLDPNAGEPIVPSLSFFTPLLVPKDVDGDSVSEMIVMHGGDALRKSGEIVRNVARLMVISSKTGRILSWSYVPDGSDSSYSPQLLVQPDGTSLVLFGTGSETQAGALYVASLDALLNDQLEHGSRLLFQDCCKGVITVPVLVDINQDDIVDIVMAHFNSTVLAFDGLTFERLWQTQFAGAQTYSTPAVGYFNQDSVPDFAVAYQYPEGYSEFDIIDGSNGQRLLKQPVRMQFGSKSSPLTVSTFAHNDIFLFWHSSCANSTLTDSVAAGNLTTGDKSPRGELRVELNASGKLASRDTGSESADLCRLLFGPNTQPFDQLKAVTSHRPPTPLYDSRTDEPIVEQVNYSNIVYQWYKQYVATGVADNEGAIASAGGDWPAQQTGFGSDNDNQAEPSLVQNGDILFSPEAIDKLRKYKKWQPAQTTSNSLLQRLLFANEQASTTDNLNPVESSPFRVANSDSRYKRAARSTITRPPPTRPATASTGTLVSSLAMPGQPSAGDQLSVDSSIDLVFVTYSPPDPLAVPVSEPSSVSPPESLQKCVSAYLMPEKELELRVMDDNSLFKRLGYDHQQYAEAVADICQKELQQGQLDAGGSLQPQSNDPVIANDWLRVMGSSTLHRVKLRCFDKVRMRQVAIKEYRYQWWPSYLGLNADSVVNLVND